MPYLRAYIRRWIEPPRHLLVALAAVTLTSAVAFGWLGWEMLRRDEAVEAQREQERLSYEADRTVQAIQQLLTANEERLGHWLNRPSGPAPETDGGVVVTFASNGAVAGPEQSRGGDRALPSTSGTSRLLFRPYVPPSAEPPPSLFTEGETAEFQSRDLRPAAAIFGRLAQSSDPAGDVPESGFIRGRLTVIGIAVMSLFLVTGVYFIGRAVRREMELARLHTDFVAAVSHEFRTPLAAMRQLSEVLAAGRVPDRARQMEYFEALSAESRRLQRLVENLLDLGRLQSGGAAYRLEPLDPRTLVERVVTEFRGEVSQAACRVDIADAADCGRVLPDPDAVGLALHNLLDNAVKYAGADPRVDVSWERQGARLGLRVRDHGPGVPPEERARIFERFVRGSAATTARVRGTWIGLALVRQIATGHGGDVAVEPAPAAGSVFTIWLPVAGDAP